MAPGAEPICGVEGLVLLGLGLAIQVLPRSFEDGHLNGGRLAIRLGVGLLDLLLYGAIVLRRRARRPAGVRDLQANRPGPLDRDAARD